MASPHHGCPKMQQPSLITNRAPHHDKNPDPDPTVIMADSLVHETTRIYPTTAYWNQKCCTLHQNTV